MEDSLLYLLVVSYFSDIKCNYILTSEDTINFKIRFLCLFPQNVLIAFSTNQDIFAFSYVISHVYIFHYLYKITVQMCESQ